MLLASTIRLLALALGAGLNVYLALLFARRRSRARSDVLAACTLGAAAVWQAANATGAFHQAAGGGMGLWFDRTAIASAALLPSLLLHLAALWSGARLRGVTAAYGAVPAAWWFLESGRVAAYGCWLFTALILSAAVCAWAGQRAVPRMFAPALCLVAVAYSAAPPASTTVAVVSAAPSAVLAWWIYRYNAFGLLIRPRFIFALKMGLVFAAYLLLVRALARIIQEEFEAFGPLVELALILAAAMVWVPLYGWMRRFLSRRTMLYASFSKRLIEEGARIVDPRERVQFLAAEVSRAFHLNRTLLLTCSDPPLAGRYGMDGGPQESRSRLLALARGSCADIISAAADGDAELRALISSAGFNYLLPLRYENRLNGLLLLDTAPRLYLDEDESILLGIAGQISHSLETAQVIAEKITLERKLAHQENLATLGRAAATIAHEVKNPLSSIKTLAQLMREDPEVESRHARDLDFILGEVDRLNRTVQQLLSFARPAPAREEEVNLSELLELTADVLSMEHSAAGIRIEHSIEPQLTLHKASGEAVQQAVLNVMLNAIQVSPAGSTVTMEARNQESGTIAIAVTDEGPGIAAEVRERMFEPFFTTLHKGTGLGLAIVRKNIDQMRGSIAVESPVTGAHGAKVTITLPNP